MSPGNRNRLPGSSGRSWGAAARRKHPEGGGIRGNRVLCSHGGWVCGQGKGRMLCPAAWEMPARSGISPNPPLPALGKGTAGGGCRQKHREHPRRVGGSPWVSPPGVKCQEEAPELPVVYVQAAASSAPGMAPLGHGGGTGTKPNCPALKKQFGLAPREMGQGVAGCEILSQAGSFIPSIPGSPAASHLPAVQQRRGVRVPARVWGRGTGVRANPGACAEGSGCWGGGGRIWGGRSPATGSRRRRLGRRAGCAGPAVAAALGVSTLTAQCLHLSIFPSPGPLLPGVISCPLRSPPTAPACPSPAASSRPPRGLSMLPENKSHAIFNRGENAKVSSSLGCCGAECGRAPPER